MSENLSEMLASPFWWVSAVLINIIAIVLYEGIKKVLPKYSESLRSKKGQRIEEQKKLAAELSTNHTRLSLYLANLIVKLMFILIILNCVSFLPVPAGVSPPPMLALLFVVLSSLLTILAFYFFLKEIIFKEMPILVLLRNLLVSDGRRNPSAKKPNTRK